MRMANAGQVFSDVNPNTVKALNSALGQDCHALQPGMVLPLSPQYPLIALGGVVQKLTPLRLSKSCRRRSSKPLVSRYPPIVRGVACLQ